jgi:hypothetical protein
MQLEHEAQRVVHGFVRRESLGDLSVEFHKSLGFEETGDDLLPSGNTETLGIRVRAAALEVIFLAHLSGSLLELRAFLPSCGARRDDS